MSSGASISTDRAEVKVSMGVLDGWRFGTQDDPQTGYDEIVFERVEA